MKSLFAKTLILTLSLPALALCQDDPEQAAEAGPLHPAQLAAESDLVALIQLESLNYERRRGFPVSGHAWGEVLISYKWEQAIDVVRIEEEGLGPDRCYFPDVPLWQELPRYLVFLNRARPQSFTGHRRGCMLEVLVTGDHRYAVRWPQDGLVLTEEEKSLIEELDFIGPGSRIDSSEMTSLRREALMRDFYMEDAGNFELRYSRGVPLSVFREQIIGGAALTDTISSPSGPQTTE